MGVARKWHFSTSGGAANLGGVTGDLSEHRRTGIPLLGITSLFMYKLTGLKRQLITIIYKNASKAKRNVSHSLHCELKMVQ